VQPRELIHSLWFDFALARIDATKQMDEILGDELYRIALYADLIPEVPGHRPMRVFRSKPFLDDSGNVVNLWIYFQLLQDERVDLLHIELVGSD